MDEVVISDKSAYRKRVLRDLYCIVKTVPGRTARLARALSAQPVLVRQQSQSGQRTAPFGG
ncbi:hypothetical protein [Paraburkholderia bannensis]|uniref:hypothetical protein n=1 Tax=Paraburkholderia bannensis TaxID=765414 RepID=UPI002ABD36A6|nr:hypothetical protein [Paraburkholderia bannensis]